MRQGQHNKRARGRHRKPQNSSNRSFESNGPEIKIRGNAAHVAEKYVALARDALTAGDYISAENYHQHAEHYFRIVAANTANQQVQAQTNQNGNASAHNAPANGEKIQVEEAAGDNQAANEENAQGESAQASEVVSADKGEEPQENAKERAPARRRSPRSGRRPAKATAKTNGSSEAPKTEDESPAAESPAADSSVADSPEIVAEAAVSEPVVETESSVAEKDSIEPAIVEAS